MINFFTFYGASKRKNANFAAKFFKLNFSVEHVAPPYMHRIIMAQEDVFKKIVSHCKEYGFVFPSSDIYDGLAAVYDYGQNGVELKKIGRAHV